MDDDVNPLFDRIMAFAKKQGKEDLEMAFASAAYLLSVERKARRALCRVVEDDCHRRLMLIEEIQALEEIGDMHRDARERLTEALIDGLKKRAEEAEKRSTTSFSKRGAAARHAENHARRQAIIDDYKAGSWQSKDEAATELSQRHSANWRTVRDYLKNL